MMPKVGSKTTAPSNGVYHTVDTTDDGYTTKAAYPKGLRPFKFHGVNFQWDQGDVQAKGDCPLCGREGRFFINPENGLWDCKVCGVSGNPTTFIRQFHELCDKETKSSDYNELAHARGLLFPETLIHWRVARSVLTGDWLVPGWGPDGKLNTLYRYVHDKASKKYKLYATPELSQQLFGVNLWNPNAKKVIFMEGPWDAMSLWEVLKSTKMLDGKPVQTGSVDSSLLAETNVIATPGCTVFPESWTSLFGSRDLVIMFDSDHPKKHPKTGAQIPPAGFNGVKRCVEILSRSEEQPNSVQFLLWGPLGYDKDRPAGFDVRDFLRGAGDKVTDRIGALPGLWEKIEDIPSDWVTGGAPGGRKGKVTLDIEPCDNWKTLVVQWRKAMKWTEGLDRALSVMLASIASTKSVGDQLWVKIVGPAACGKSTLCEAISTNRKHVLAKSTIRGFHSGFQRDGGKNNEDNSLIAQLYDKTLVTKDGDTLLQSPNLPQILSEARDIYDRTSRTHYRHGINRDYDGVNMTWILCGTSSLRALDSSELGERFLDCVIMDGIDEDLEDEILLRVAHRVDRTLSIDAGKVSQDPELTLAMRMTGGYIEHLRAIAQQGLSDVVFSDDMLHRVIKLGKFVAYMRARPSTRQKETAEREFATRLVSQLCRMAKCLAVVLNKDTVDEEVMRRVTRCAMDTARGITMDILKHLAEFGSDGLEPRTVATRTNQSEEHCRSLLRFLKKIGVIDVYTPTVVRGVTGRPRWRHSDRMAKLYAEVIKYQQ
jgi:hypothetical protein